MVIAVEVILATKIPAVDSGNFNVENIRSNVCMYTSSAVLHTKTHITCLQRLKKNKYQSTWVGWERESAGCAPSESKDRGFRGESGGKAPRSWRVFFYPRGASDARVLAIIVCPCVCVCVCVCVSHAGIVSKRLNVGSRKQHHVIAQGL